MDEELYTKTYSDALDCRTRQIQSRLQFMKEVKDKAKMIRNAHKKFNKKENDFSKNIDKILDGTNVIDSCDRYLQEIFDDSKNIYDEDKIYDLSMKLLPNHVGIWDKTKETYKQSIQQENSSDDPKSEVLSHMIESGIITLPTPPESTI